MKRIIVCILLIAMMMSVTPAYAAGKLTEDTENFFVVDSYRTYTYCYAKYKNIGDKPIAVNAGLLEVFDENGDTITSTDTLYSYAKYLQPDEYTYVSMYTDVEEGVTVDDYLLTVTGKSDMDYYAQRLDVVTDYQAEVTKGYSTYDYMYATVTNNTEDTVEDIRIVLALLDDDDNILYVTSDSLGSDVGLHPGSTVTFSIRVNSDNKESYEAAGFTATKVDAIAYSHVKIEG